MERFYFELLYNSCSFVSILRLLIYGALLSILVLVSLVDYRFLPLATSCLYCIAGYDTLMLR